MGSSTASFAMTGYRLGFLIAPKQFVPTLKILLQNFFLSANSFVQRAGIAALREGGQDQEKMRQIFAERRRVMLEGVRRLGFEVKVPPTGAFYIFANTKRFSKNSLQLSKSILYKADVAVTPGIDFGSAGEGFLRFSYATSTERIKEGMGRVEKFLKGGL